MYLGVATVPGMKNGLREINELRNVLWGLLTRYKATLAEHDLPLPFDEVP